MSQDKIRLEGMVFYGHHGVAPAEREVGQRFVVDLEVERDLSVAGASDNLEDTVNYTQIYRAVKEIVEGPSHNLLESLAHDIARRVLEQLPMEAVRVGVKKPNPPIKGAVLSGASVEIYRRRGG